MLERASAKAENERWTLGGYFTAQSPRYLSGHGGLLYGFFLYRNGFLKEENIGECTGQ